METMVLLVFLAIVWAAVGVYWLKTRIPTPSMAFGGSGRRASGLAPMASLSSITTRRGASAPLLPVQGARTVHAGPGHQGQARVPQLHAAPAHGHPGHSLTAPARRAAPATLARETISSEKARIRRRNVLVGLFGLAAITLVGAFVIGGAQLILAHLVADALLLGFILLLVQYQREIELDRTRNLPVYAEPRAQQPLAATGTDGRA